MRRTRQRGSVKCNVLWFSVAVVGVGIITASWIVCGPRPTDFAGCERVALADYRGVDPTGTPPDLKAASQLERGEYLTRAADCEVCHTATDGAPFAGGRAFVLPFGTLYSTNITPDPDTGIGNYSDADFLNAVHKGIGRSNKRLYPAMPYASYTYMTDADALAIKIYLFSLKPVRAPTPRNTLKFPFNQRGLMSIWSALFNPDKRFEPLVRRDPRSGVSGFRLGTRHRPGSVVMEGEKIAWSHHGRESEEPTTSGKSHANVTRRLPIHV
jgi:hypothetical protein